MVQKTPSLKFTTDAQNPTDPDGFVKYFQRVIHCMPNNVYWLNSECITMGCNKNTLNLLGLDSVDQFIGMTYEEMGELAGWTENQAGSFKKDDMEVISTGKPKINIEEPPLYDDNGDPVYYMSTRVPIFDDNDNVMGVVGISVDITDRKKMEESLRRANEVKSEFIANMSHDLRTPMTGVMGMLDEIDLLAEDASKILLPQNISESYMKIVSNIKKYVGIAQRSNKELLSMFNDILEMVKIDSGKIEEIEENFSLASLIHSQKSLLSSAAKDKGVRIIVSIDPDLPEYFYGYRRPLLRSVTNLIGNALKFTEKGSVTIGVVMSSDSSPVVGDLVSIRLWVEDTGVGIPESKFEVIFDNFSKITSSYKSSSYQGSGLGLYTVKKYIDYMDGSITLNSKVGEGSCFTIDVPLVVSDRTDIESDKNSDLKEFEDIAVLGKGSPIANDNEPGFKEGRVLVVEDNDAAAMSVIRSLNRLGYSSDRASTGKEAVLMVENNDYLIVFMDIGLPEMNGLEATEKIRSISNEKRSQVPIVALTGHEDRVKECTDAGMQGLMQKPAQSNKIKEMLAKQGVGSNESLSLPIIDWDECVSMCFGEEEAREITSMCAQGIRDGKKTIEKYYNDRDIPMLRAELHKARGGVCYLKLPELEYRLRDFHVAIKENHDPDELEKKYKALVEAEDRFLAMCSDRGLL